MAAPGKRFYYTDTNYYLLGLIIERISGKPFHELMHEYVFDPLGMQYTCVHGFSSPMKAPASPVARSFIKGHDLMAMEGIHQIDYAGGGVVAPLSDYLIFMKALIGNQLIQKQTLGKMIMDDIYMGFPTIGFNYGYGVWKMRNIPWIMPGKYYSWGCVGVRGAFMFYHPLTESIMIGSFNDFSYRGKALQFMARKVIRPMLD